MLNLNPTKWKIIEELSKKNLTPTELSKKLGITLPSLHTQLKELEQKELIKKSGEIKGKTRPYAEYSLGEGFLYFIKVLPNEVEKKLIQIDNNVKLHLRIWSIPQKQYHYYIESIWWKLQDYIDEIDSIILYGSVASGQAKEGSDIDILLLVKKNPEKYEKLFGAKLIGKKEKRKMLMIQAFETKDFSEALKKSSDFAKEIIKNNIILYDKESKFTKIKNES